MPGRTRSSRERGLDFLTARCPRIPPRPASCRASSGRSILAVIVARGRLPVRASMTAVYLEEYAPRHARSRGSSRSTSATSPASRPSSTACSGCRCSSRCSSRSGIGNGRNVLAGGATLAVLVLPIVIITSIEALRAVPIAHPRGGLRRRRVALGGRPPARAACAAPGILTGTVLALSRALGETAPLLLAGAVLGFLLRRPASSTPVTGQLYRAADHRLRLGAQAAGRSSGS